MSKSNFSEWSDRCDELHLDYQESKSHSAGVEAELWIQHHTGAYFIALYDVTSYGRKFLSWSGTSLSAWNQI